MDLKFGFFRSFKGDDTLLIWGNDGFDKLRDLFEHLANSPTKSVEFRDVGYLIPAGSCSVTVSCARTEPGSLNIAVHDSQTVITCFLTQKELTAFSTKIDDLVKNRDRAAHQYLDTESAQPFQIIVAKGEYPEDLSPYR